MTNYRRLRAGNPAALKRKKPVSKGGNNRTKLGTSSPSATLTFPCDARPVAPPVTAIGARAAAWPLSLPGHSRRLQAAGGIGNGDLDCLWNLSADNMTALAPEVREHACIPPMRKFFEPVMEEMDPDNGFEDEFKHKNDKVYSWKAHRILAKTNLQMFSKMGPSDDLDSVAKLMFPEDVPASLQDSKVELVGGTEDKPKGMETDTPEAKADVEGGHSNKRVKTEAT
ncbi:hypothetical protein CYMTET_33716 [Cymbomonas tetramitiformis]|uniref:Uncharacterized protein n=1 Tax=Cymbomonas tetramitiformis TaxID=36881 RepID=A0AAE0FD42_9CHLO|nr:hypothetical protein CYMTET_33716 [Cymbomonas tetramitiformis]